MPFTYVPQVDVEVHPTAIVESRLFNGTRIYARAVVEDKVSAGHRFIVGVGAIVRANNTFGSDCVVGSGSVIEPGCVIGDRVRIQCLVSMGKCDIGDDVSIGNGVNITDTPHPKCKNLPCPAGRVRIGEGAVIGGGVTITPGVTIGEGAFVAAGAVVSRDVPPFTLVYSKCERVERPVSDMRCRL